MEYDDACPYAPEIAGRLWIAPHIEEGHEVHVDIVGDPDGLRSLGESLIFLADADRSERRVPPGEREHVHLVPKQHFGSCGQFGVLEW
jgi:hypothetical protein